MEDQQQTNQTKSMDDIMALCKRRGFIYQASEIYGGINGFWDYGPLGAQLKKNLRDAWWQDVVMNPCVGKPGPDGEHVEIVPVDTCIIQNPKVWEASGHVGGFNDPMVDDKETKQRFRADHLFGLFIYEAEGGKADPYRDVHTRAAEVLSFLPVITMVGGSVGEASDVFAKEQKDWSSPFRCRALSLRIRPALFRFCHPGARSTPKNPSLSSSLFITTT